MTEFKLTRRRWTNEEEAELRNLYGNEPVTEIARRFKRSENSVRKRASVLGLKSNHREYASERRFWSEDEEWTLVEKFHNTDTQELAKELDRSETALINRARLINVENRYATGA